MVLLGFLETLIACAFLDLPMVGYLFTWIRHKGKSNDVQERLDRALITYAWLNLFPNGSLCNAFASISNHSLIILLTEEHVLFSSNRCF